MLAKRKPDTVELVTETEGMHVAAGHTRSRNRSICCTETRRPVGEVIDNVESARP